MPSTTTKVRLPLLGVAVGPCTLMAAPVGLVSERLLSTRACFLALWSLNFPSAEVPVRMYFTASVPLLITVTRLPSTVTAKSAEVPSTVASAVWEKVTVTVRTKVVLVIASSTSAIAGSVISVVVVPVPLLLPLFVPPFSSSMGSQPAKSRAVSAIRVGILFIFQELVSTF